MSQQPQIVITQIAPITDKIVTVNGAGEDVNLGAFGLTSDYLKVNTNATPRASAPGLIQWNSVDGTYDMGLLNSSVLQVGQETMFYGKASGAIANGDLCQFAGVQGDHILIKKAVGSEIEANPHFLVGIATENIANGVFGYVTWFGKINGVYTKTPANQDSVDWVAGDILYFNVTTGQLTKTMPSVPNRIIIVAAVIKEQTGASESGIIIVRPTFGTKLQDLDDVNGTPLSTTGQIPVWNNTEGYFDFTEIYGVFGTDTDNTTFEADGTLKMNGTATVFDDVNASISSGRVGVANFPNWSAFIGNLYEYTFAVNDYIDLGAVEMPHSYKEGSNFEIHVHSATNGLDVTDRGIKWEIEYAIQNDSYSAGIGPAWSAATVVSAETTIPANTPDRSGVYTSVTTVTGTGIKMGSNVKMRLRRIASTGTAPTNNPFAIQVGIHFEQDTLGSRTGIAK